MFDNLSPGQIDALQSLAKYLAVGGMVGAGGRLALGAAQFPRPSYAPPKPAKPIVVDLPYPVSQEEAPPIGSIPVPRKNKELKELPAKAAGFLAGSTGSMNTSLNSLYGTPQAAAPTLPPATVTPPTSPAPYQPKVSAPTGAAPKSMKSKSTGGLSSVKSATEDRPMPEWLGKILSVGGLMPETAKDVWGAVPQYTPPFGRPDAQTASDVPGWYAAAVPGVAGALGAGFMGADRVVRAAERNRAQKDLDAARQEYQKTVLDRAKAIYFPTKTAAEVEKLITAEAPTDPELRQVKNAIDAAYEKLIKSAAPPDLPPTPMANMPPAWKTPPAKPGGGGLDTLLKQPVTPNMVTKQPFTPRTGANLPNALPSFRSSPSSYSSTPGMVAPRSQPTAPQPAPSVPRMINQQPPVGVPITGGSGGVYISSQKPPVRSGGYSKTISNNQGSMAGGMAAAGSPMQTPKTMSGGIGNVAAAMPSSMPSGTATAPMPRAVTPTAPMPRAVTPQAPMPRAANSQSGLLPVSSTPQAPMPRAMNAPTGLLPRPLTNTAPMPRLKSASMWGEKLDQLEQWFHRQSGPNESNLPTGAVVGQSTSGEATLGTLLAPGFTFGGRAGAAANAGIIGTMAGLGGYLGYQARRDHQQNDDLRREVKKVDSQHANNMGSPLVARLVPVAAQ